MKKYVAAILLAALTVSSLTACGGNDEVKTIEKKNDVAVDNSSDNSGEEADNNADASVDGFVFEAEGVSGTVALTPDMDMADVLDDLGEAGSYYEAASCAFQGLDKMYTYNHFEVDTYPDGDVDRISAIVLLDDMITTPEGVYVGQSQADMEAAYGTDYEVVAGAYVYTKGNSQLVFVLSGDSIASIEYKSPVLDMAD